MSVECFLDTNVLVYAVSSTDRDKAKRTRALELVQGSDFGLSAQVLQEFSMPLAGCAVVSSADRHAQVA